MCGIVGYTGTKKAKPILIDGLLKLEYRGYDSAGIAVLEGDSICVKKDKGRVKALEDLEGINNLKGTVGVAHTRWATHGKPAEENSHPHTDVSKSFSVVHNGIIENYSKIKNMLTENGYKFISKTDTEVIPNLIHYYYNKEPSVAEPPVTFGDSPLIKGAKATAPLNKGAKRDAGKFLEAVHRACADLEGSYAIGVVSKFHPDIIIAAKKDSPLVIGRGEGENYIASDAHAVLEHTRDFYFLDDYEIAEVSKDGIKIYDRDLKLQKREPKNVKWDEEEMNKGKYPDFMLKEISEQPDAIKQTIGSKLNGDKVEFDKLSFTKEYLSSINRIYIVACGTAMHVGLATKTTFEKFCKIPTEVDIASEFRYRNPLIDSKTLTIFISQSGETADTIAALKLAKEKGAKTIAVSNVVGSSITREADYSLYIKAGTEISVASTKAYTSQVVLVTLLAMYFAEILESVDPRRLRILKHDIIKLPTQVEEILKNTDNIKEIAHKIYTEKDVFFIGRGEDYACGLEGSLKLKEISYIHSDAYASGELKHGPIALIENGTTVVAIITEPRLTGKSLSNVYEVITRGAKILLVTNQKMRTDEFEWVIKVPETDHLISPVLAMVPLQLLAYYITKEKGLDVDKPRNLAKSVTVE